jgi:hypothetical protein
MELGKVEYTGGSPSTAGIEQAMSSQHQTHSPTAQSVIPHVYCLFQQPWWLEAIAPGQWDEVVVTRNGEVCARLPYVIKSRFGLKAIAMPSLTQTLGPWLMPSKTKYSKQLAQQKDLMTALIEQLPPHDYFSQGFHYSITNYLPFYWQGFTQTTFYTYVIEDLTDLNKVWQEFQDNIRYDIKKAKKSVVVNTEPNIDRFLDINTLTFTRQGLPLPYTRELVRRLDSACEARNARRMFFAEDAEGRTHAAIYLVWDENSAYYLMGGGDPELRSSGATSLLMWEAIQFAASVTRTFDFEGSMGESIERFFRGFGARQVPYFYVRRMSHRLKVLSSGREMIKAIMGR